MTSLQTEAFAIKALPTLRQTLDTFLATTACAEITRIKHTEYSNYLVDFFGDRPLHDFAGASGGELVATYLREETIGGKRNIRKKLGGRGSTQPKITYNSARTRVNTLRLALQAAVSRGELSEVPNTWPIPRPGIHGHVTARVHVPGAQRTRKLIKKEWTIPAPGASNSDGKATLTQAMIWAQKIVLIHVQAATKTATRDLWKKLLKFFGDRPIADFEGPKGYDLACTYVEAETERGVKYCTIKKNLNALRVLLREGHRRGVLSGLPPWPKLPCDSEPRTRYLTREEYEAFRSHAWPRLRLWVDICLWTGMHSSDVNSMTWQEVSLPKLLWLRHNTKNKTKPDWLPMPSQFHEALTEAINPLFPPSPSEPIVGRIFNFSKHVKRICKLIDIPHFAPIDLRRTCATLWVEGGGPKDGLKKWLGHSGSSYMIDKHYAQVTPSMLLAGCEALSKPREVTSATP